MENTIITINLKRLLYKGVLHEQVENGTTISNNLSANYVNQWFEIPQVASIIPCDVQTGEAHRRTNSLLQNSKKEEFHIKMQTHRLNLDKRAGNLNFDRKLCWNQ
jgi:hypothetical protein